MKSTRRAEFFFIFLLFFFGFVSTINFFHSERGLASSDSCFACQFQKTALSGCFHLPLLLIVLVQILKVFRQRIDLPWSPIQVRPFSRSPPA